MKRWGREILPVLGGEFSSKSWQSHVNQVGRFHIMTPEPNSDPTAFLMAIVESTDDAIFGLSLDDVVISWNRSAAKLYGYAAEEIIGQKVFLLAPADRLSEMERNLGRLKQGELIPHFETVRIRKDGTPIEVSVSISLVKNAAITTGIVVIARDISAVRRARREMDTASQIKMHFLNNMNHEIRTPMNGILGMTELVLDTDLTQEQRESLALVKLSTESLIAAVDDVMDFSDMEAGRLVPESIPFNFRESVGETMKMLGFRAHNKGLELIYEVAWDIPDILIGDPGRIRRVLSNIVGNAIKFTEWGEVIVRVQQMGIMNSQMQIHFAVKDTGVGISRDRLYTIFEPFEQADSSMTRRYGGMGLGLALAKRLVELAGGNIWVESELGEGSVFHFSVPLRISETPQIPPPSIELERLRGMAILIVDDNALSRRVLRGILSHWEMKATDAADGSTALHILRAARDIGHPFRVVLLNGQLKKMDGFDLAEQIKTDPTLVGATVMMLTSVGHIGDAARCRGLGVSAYLVKPIRPTELVEAISLALVTDQTPNTQLVTRHSLREIKSRQRSEAQKQETIL